MNETMILHFGACNQATRSWLRIWDGAARGVRGRRMRDCRVHTYDLRFDVNCSILFTELVDRLAPARRVVIGSDEV